MSKEVFLASGHESGSVVSTRSSAFKPISNYLDIVAEFEKSYDLEANPSISKLFDISGSEEIVVTIYDCILINYFEDESDKDAIEAYLKQNGNSDWMIAFMKEHSVELYASEIIGALAFPGQTLRIQTTDLEYGNEEFELRT
ncbi:MAG: hypothetical protein EBS17_08415 [Flavobacteriia bacterium]|nr:hypothetical protein [Flavobacteriia bacterium]